MKNQENTQHGFLIEAANVEPRDSQNEVDDTILEEELRSYQHFPVDAALERERHKLFSYAIYNVNAILVERNSDHFFKSLKSAAKEAFAFVLIFPPLLRLKKQYPAGLNETCMHHGRLDTAERDSQQN